MKKFFAIAMSVLMIACFMPSMAFAANVENCQYGESCTVHEAAIGKTHYDTLAEAIGNVKAGETITLLKNVKIPDSYHKYNRLLVSANNVTIDMNDKTLTTPDRAFQLAGNNITIKDGIVETVDATENTEAYKAAYAIQANGNKTRIENITTINGGINVNGYQYPNTNESVKEGVTATIKDCNITAGEYYTVCAQGKAQATVENCTLETAEKSTAFFWIENSNSSITYDAKSVTLKGSMPLYNTAGVAPVVENLTVKDKNGNDQTIEAVAVSTEAHLKAAIENKKNVMLANDIKLKSALEINKSVMIMGDGKTKLVNDDKTSGNQSRVINIESSEAGDLKDITLTLSGIDIVGPTVNGYNRGVSAWGVNNLTVIMDNCSASANHYALNIAGSNTKPKVIVRNTTLKGYSAFQTWSANTEAIFENCTLTGLNQWSGSSDDFATLVVNVGAELTNLKFKNCCIEANEKGTGGTPADEKLISVRENKATVTFEGCKFFVNNDEVTGEKRNSEMEYADGYEIATVTYDVAGGSNVNNTNDVTVVYDDDKEVELTLPTPTRSGYTFNSWYTEKTKVVSPYTVTGDVTLTASWSRIRSGSSSSASTTTTDNVANKTEDKGADTSTSTGATTVATTTATVKTETKTAADGTKTVAATVDTTTASKIVEKAVENKSEEVVVNTATATTVTEAAAGTKTEIALPEQTVKAIAKETEAAVTIKSDAAEVKLDTEAVKAVADQAGDLGTVNLVVETVAQNESKVEVDLKLVTSKGTVSDFKGGSVSVTVKLNTALAAKPVVCVYIDNFGTYHKVKGVKNADGTFTFETGHFSTYAVMAEEEADGVIAEQTKNVEEKVGDLSLKARSAKTEKGSIKVTLTVDDEAIKAIEDLGYTVKYKFYRSTEKSASYKAALEKTEKTYTNTTGKKGTKYYYKARVMVYNAQGALLTKSELKQCRYACRIR